MGALDGQCDGMIITNFYGDVTINDFDEEAGDDDSSTSYEDFKFDKAHQQEWDDNQKTEDTFLSKLESMEDGEINDGTFESQGEHFDQIRWIDSNAEAPENNKENEVDKEDINYAMEKQPADNIDDDNSVDNIDVDKSDDTTVNNDNIKSDPMEYDTSDEVNGANNYDEVNHMNALKELQDTLGSYCEAPTGRRVACVYWIENLDDFLWNN